MVFVAADSGSRSLNGEAPKKGCPALLAARPCQITKKSGITTAMRSVQQRAAGLSMLGMRSIARYSASNRRAT